MKLKNHHTLFVLVLLYSLYSIQLVISVPTNPIQVYWYEQYVARSTGVGTPEYDYHIIGMKFYSDYTAMDHTVPPKPRTTNPYLVVHKKDSTASPNQIIRKMYKSNYSSYDYLSFYFPNMDATHDKPYVIWDLTIDCLGFSKFKIKFFSCDKQANTFYTALTNANKLQYSTASGNFANAVYSAPADCANRTAPLSDDATLKALFSGVNATLDALVGTPASDTCTVCTYA